MKEEEKIIGEKGRKRKKRKNRKKERTLKKN